MTTITKTIAAALLLALSSNTALGGEFKPIRQVTGAADDYPSVRCAAVIMAIYGWTGEEYLGKEKYAEGITAIMTFTYIAALMRQDNNMGGDLEADIVPTVTRDVEAIQKIYRQRIEANYATQGEGWGSDTLILDDFQLCQELVALTRNSTD